jgi:threonine aldolase
MAREIDLRSDTVTLPPPGMRDAIAGAELGDDVYAEDPTVNRLEALAAGMLGMEAALLTTSGTMANLLAMMAHCPRGRKVLVGDLSDLWRWEAHGGSVLAGLAYHPVPTGSTGEIAIADLERAIDDPTDLQCAIAGLLCLENTHGMCGGRVLSIDYLARAQMFARGRRIPLHLDGARLFNAAIALKVAPRTIASFADTVAFCLSKGLAAPVGSILAGGAAVIAGARRLRKMLGGGMRQAGIIAAGGIYALEHMIERLAEDHATARQLADGLARVPGITVDQPPPQTNIVFWRIADPSVRIDTFIGALREHGVRVMELGPGRIRAVTHYGITPDDVSRAIAAVTDAIERSRRAIDVPAFASRSEKELSPW